MPYLSDAQRKAVWAKKRAALKKAEEREKKITKEASYYGINKLKKGA